ncbi:MAG: hypothetical protein BWY28_02383 [bacterium ADurb.Bin236]|nr:MAG: hypothetical protein BWY28_02383 [bacterium ADurb.Bin236]
MTLVVFSGVFSMSNSVPRTPATAVGVLIENSELGLCSFSAFALTLPVIKSRFDVTVFVLGSMSISLIVKFVKGLIFNVFEELHLTVADDFAPVFICVPLGRDMLTVPGCHEPPGNIICTSPVTLCNDAVTGSALRCAAYNATARTKRIITGTNLIVLLHIERPPLIKFFEKVNVTVIISCGDAM